MNDTKTVSGAIVHITDADEAPLVRCLVDITPKQSGTGTPSPDNVRPISGWTEVKVIVSPTQEATDGHTTTTSLGRTVYGGTLDVVTGVLTVTHGYMNYTNISTTSGVAVTGGWRCNFLCPDGDINKGKWTVQSAPTLSMFDSSKPLNEGGISKGYAANNYTVIVPNATSKETADATLEGLELVYPLATPQTYTLTPQQIDTLLGDNNVWADSGDVEITYHTDTLGIYNKIYINGSPYFRPNDFEVKREDVYAGEYTSCTGKLIADKIGWKYSDLTLKWDILPDEDLVYLTTLTGIFSIAFRDSDGQHTEQVIRRGFANTPTRVTGPSGTKIWTDVEMEISFLNTHTEGE